MFVKFIAKLLRILALAFVTLALLLGVAFLGVLFALWPTWMNDTQLQVSGQMITQLTSLKAEKKFIKKAGTPLYLKDGTLVLGPPPGWYPGAPSEAIRMAAQLGVDRVIDQLLTSLPNDPRRSTVLASFKRALPAYDAFDSEEKDQMLDYFERILEITGVQNSGELFNVWRYGLPYGWMS